MNRLCVYKCGASSEQCGVFGQSDVQRVEYNVGNGSDINTLNMWGGSDMEKDPVPRSRRHKKLQ